MNVSVAQMQQTGSVMSTQPTMMLMLMLRADREKFLLRMIEAGLGRNWSNYTLLESSY